MITEMKAAKNTKKNVPTKARVQKSKKAENVKETSGSSKSSLQSNSKKPSTTAPPQGSSSSVQTAADERRLRKLKVFLKSVSYNGCEGANLPNLNDLYADQLLVDEFPCQELSKNEEFKCNPTPFVIASCFNRNQVKENSNNNDKGNKAVRRTPRKQNSTPRRRNPQNNDSSKTTKQNSPRQPCEPSTLQQLKSPLSAEKTNPVRRLFADKQCDKSEHVSPRKEENLTKQYVPVKLDEKKTVRQK